MRRPHPWLPCAVLCAFLAACSAATAPADPSSDASLRTVVTTSPTPSRASLPATPEATATPFEPAWSEVGSDGSVPAAREDHTWTVGPDGVAYLFGGRDAATSYADLWAYDLASDTWTALDAGGPAARFGHNAAWVSEVGLVIFAGQAGATFFNDLWAYDPATDAWRQLPAGETAPTPRYGSCAAIGPDGRLWISHGFTQDQTRFDDTWTYDFGTGSWADVTPDADLPIARCLHACWWTDHGRFALYAGQTTDVTALGDRWILEPGAAWTRVEGEGPPDRNLYAAARWENGTVVFGGQTLDASYLADAWRIGDDGSTEVVAANGAAPAPRAGGELIADPERGRLLLFGGRDASVHFADVWTLRLAADAG